MTNERFFRGLLAALRLQGEEKIVTRDDAHHHLLDAVTQELEEARQRGDDAARDMPETLIPNPITGRYRDWDSALVTLQRGRLLAGRNPSYPLVEILFDQGEAEQLLDRYTPAQRELFKKLASTYRAGLVPS